MFKRSVCSGILILIFLASGVLSAAPADYFPVEVGTAWTYVGSPLEAVRGIRLADAEDTDEGTIYFWDGFLGRRVVRKSGGKVFELRDEQWRLLFDFEAEKGASWTIEGRGENGGLLAGATVTIASRTAEVVTPIGKFSDVIRFEMRPAPGLADAGVAEVWFAPKVGLIKWVEVTIAGPQTYELAEMAGQVGEPVVVLPDSGSSEPGVGIPMPLPTPVVVDYFPVGLGLTWTYGGNPREVAQLVRILDAEETEEGLVYFWEGFQGRRLVRIAGQKIWELQGETWRLLFDFETPEGASWTIEGDLETGDLLAGTTVTVESRSAEVRVPYGSYDNSIHLVLHPAPGLADAGVTEMWFVPWLGLVKWTEMTIAGPQSYDLVSFVNRGAEPVEDPGDTLVVGPRPVDPFPFPPFPGISIEDVENRVSVEREGVQYEIGTDKETYGQDEAITIVYQITAVEQDSVTFRFRSTQQFDFWLLNDQDETAWVWSATRSFGDALTSFTLKQGESRTFSATLYVEEVVAPEGMYRLLGFMPTGRFDGETVEKAATEAAVMVEILGVPVRAQLTGEVRDEDGEPVLGAQVSLMPNKEVVEGTLSAIVTRTDRAGQFRFDRVVPGDYTVRAMATDFHPDTTTVSLVAGYHMVNLTLKRGTREDFLNTHTTQHDRLIAELATDRQRYAAGDSVYVRYRLTNPGEEPLTLMFRSGQQYDLVLEGSRGKVWQWGEGKLFTQALGSQVLGPGETFEFRAAVLLWEGWARAGESYLLTGFLTVSPDEAGAVAREETEAVVKFAVDSGGMIPLPEPRPLGRVLANLKVNQAFYKFDGSVEVDYRLVNVSDTPQTLMFSSGQRYDLGLDGPDGQIWTWSSSRSFVQSIGEITLAPRDTFAFQERIHLPDVGADVEGVYILTALMTVAPGDSGAVMLEETVARARFVVNREGKGSGESPPDPPPDSLPGAPGDRDLETSNGASIAGDFDESGTVNFADFVMFARAYGTSSQMLDFNRKFDLDDDGDIGFRDFVMFATAFGN